MSFSNRQSYRHFKIAAPYLAALLVITLTYVGKLAIEKAKEKYREYKNRVQEINTVSATVHENAPPAAQQIQFNNAAHNPQIVATLPLTFALIIFCLIGASFFISLYLQSFEIMKLLKLGVHRTIVSIAIPLFFYVRNPLMRKFVCEMYFDF